MPGTYCQYINCKRPRKKPGFPNLKMFRFPTNQDLSKQWITNCGRARFFNLTPKQLHSKYICERHFTLQSFMDSTYKQRLVPSAIPVHFQAVTDTITVKSEAPPSPLTVARPVKTYKPAEKRDRPSPNQINQSPPSPESAVVEEDIDIKPIELISPCPDHQSSDKDIEPIPCTPEVYHHHQPMAKRKLGYDYSPREVKLKDHIEKQRKLIKSKQMQLARMKVKVAKLKELTRLQTMFDNFEFSSQPSRTIAKMQFKTQHREWTIEERNLALMMFYKSPTTYSFLRRLGIVLPSDSTIRHWIGRSKFQSSFSKRYLRQIGNKCDSGSPNADALCFDEITSTNDDEGSVDRPNEMDVMMEEGCEEDLDGHLSQSEETESSDPTSVPVIQEESI